MLRSCVGPIDLNKRIYGAFVLQATHNIGLYLSNELENLDTIWLFFLMFCIHDNIIIVYNMYVYIFPYFIDYRDRPNFVGVFAFCVKILIVYSGS